MRRKLKAWWLQFDRLSLFCFVIGTGLLSALNAQRILGILMVLALSFQLFSRTQRQTVAVRGFPPELICYSLWVLWTGVTGSFVAGNIEFFWVNYRVVLQMLVMVWTIYGLLRCKMTPQVVFLGIVGIGIIQIVAAITGISEVGDLTQIEDRITGLTNNPNVLGYLVMAGVMTSVLFWHEPFLNNTIRKAMIIGFVMIGGYVSAISGSRKSLMIFGVFLASWGVFVLPRGRGMQVMAVRVVALVLVSGLIALAIPFVMEQTAFGARWDELLKAGHGDVEEGLRENVRYEMMQTGLRMFRENPIAGVGLGQFQTVFITGQYSHSDIIEPLATTGGVGILLYQSFYYILLFRLFKLLRLTRAPVDQYRFKVLIVSLIVILLFGLGSPNINSQPVFLYLATLSAYTWTKLHELRAGVGAAMGLQPRPSPQTNRLGARTAW